MPPHPGRQRSVLVVGDGLTAAATAGFLDQAGLDPVVAAPPSRQQPAGITVLWRPGLVLLERIGLRRPIERIGEPLTSRRLPADRSKTEAAATDTEPTADAELTADTETAGTTAVDAQSALVAVDRERLVSLFERYVLGSLRVTDRAVTAVEPTDAGVRSTFAGGVTESFDAVVMTSRSLGSNREPTAAGVGCWRFDWPEDVPVPPAPAALWGDRRAALFVAANGSLDVRLVSAAGIDAGTALSPVDLDQQFGELFAPHPAPFSALAASDLQYCRLPAASPTTLSTDGLVPIGPSSRLTIPGDCLGATRGIEEAWIVADTLAYGPDDLAAALADADSRRRRRAREYVTAVAAVASTVDADRQSGDDGHPTDSSPWLRWLRARRRLAFGHLIDGRLPAVAESIPQRL